MRVENAKARKRLGFIDLEEDADGNSIEAVDGLGVSDPVMEELQINSTRYEKAVQETKARKRIKITTPVEGISRDEYKAGMLRSEEYFRDA